MKKWLFNLGNLLIVTCSLINLSSCDSKKNGTWKVDKVKLYPLLIHEKYVLPPEKDQLYCYIDEKGEIVIPPQFIDASLFRDGRAVVKYKDADGDEVCGYIDEKGDLVSGGYLGATFFCDGRALTTRKDEAISIIDLNGQVMSTLKDCDVYEWSGSKQKDMKLISTGKKASIKIATAFYYGVSLAYFTDMKTSCLIPINYNGKVIKIPEELESLDWAAFDRGYYPLKNKNTGCIVFMDTEGRILCNEKGGPLITSDKIDYVKVLSPTFRGFIFRQSGKYGVMDWNGDCLIEPQFEDMIQDGKLFAVCSSGMWGWCDEGGHFVINPQYQSIGRFGDENLAPVQQGGDFGYIDKEGRSVIRPQFGKAMNFEGGIACVCVGDVWGVINSKGRYVVNPQYDYIYPFQKNSITAVINNMQEVGLIDRTGKVIDNMNFRDISEDYKGQPLEGNYGYSPFVYVNSDYFDVKEVSEMVTDLAKQAPLGQDVKSLMQTFNLKRSTFKSDWVELKEVRDGNYFSYHLQARGNFYRKVGSAYKFAENTIPHSYDVIVRCYTFLEEQEARRLALRKTFFKLCEENIEELAENGYKIRYHAENSYPAEFILRIEKSDSN